MSAAADYLENAILNHIFGGPDFARPATLYFALFTSAPTDAGGGTEVSGGSYARAAVTNNATNFPAAAGGQKTNGTVITFAQATAPWGTILAFGIFDALSGGNLLFWATLTTGVTIGTGSVYSIPVGSLVLTAA